MNSFTLLVNSNINFSARTGKNRKTPTARQIDTQVTGGDIWIKIDKALGGEKAPPIVKTSKNGGTTPSADPTSHLNSQA